MPDDVIPADEGAWSRAVADAGKTYLSAPFSLGTGIGSLLAAFTAALATASEDAETQALAGVVSGLAVLAVILVGTFVIHLLRAPIRQRDELRSRVRTLERRDPAAAQAQGQLRVAVAQISEELEHVQATLRDEDGWPSYFADYELPAGKWELQGHVIAEHGFADAHRAARVAYLEIDGINRSIQRGSRAGRAASNCKRAPGSRQYRVAVSLCHRPAHYPRIHARLRSVGTMDTDTQSYAGAVLV